MKIVAKTLKAFQHTSLATAESMCVYAVFVGCICGGPHLNCMGFAYNPLGPQFRELSVNYAHALPKNEPGAARQI